MTRDYKCVNDGPADDEQYYWIAFVNELLFTVICYNVNVTIKPTCQLLFIDRSDQVCSGGRGHLQHKWVGYMCGHESQTRTRPGFIK